MPALLPALAWSSLVAAIVLDTAVDPVVSTAVDTAVDAARDPAAQASLPSSLPSTSTGLVLLPVDGGAAPEARAALTDAIDAELRAVLPQHDLRLRSVDAPALARDAGRCHDDACAAALARRVKAGWFVRARLDDAGHLELSMWQLPHDDGDARLVRAASLDAGLPMLLARAPAIVRELVEVARPQADVRRARALSRAALARRNDDVMAQAQALRDAAVVRTPIDDAGLELLQDRARVFDEAGLRDDALVAWDDVKAALSTHDPHTPAHARVVGALCDHLAARATFWSDVAAADDAGPDRDASLQRAARAWDDVASLLPDDEARPAWLSAAELWWMSGDVDAAWARVQRVSEDGLVIDAQRVRRELLARGTLLRWQQAVARGEEPAVDEDEPPSQTAEPVPPSLRAFVDAAHAWAQLEPAAAAAHLLKGALLLAALGHVDDARALLDDVTPNDPALQQQLERERTRLRDVAQGPALLDDDPVSTTTAPSTTAPSTSISPADPDAAHAPLARP